MDESASWKGGNTKDANGRKDEHSEEGGVRWGQMRNRGETFSIPFGGGLLSLFNFNKQGVRIDLWDSDISRCDRAEHHIILFLSV